jgi:hypothetical protein
MSAAGGWNHVSDSTFQSLYEQSQPQMPARAASR